MFGRLEPHSLFLFPRLAAVTVLVALTSGMIGCAGYQLGAASLYRPDIRTIYVPMIRNDTWRPWLGVQLTEQVQKAIQSRTPFRIVNDPSADSILTCRVIGENKRVITETRNDDPRALDAKLSVQLTWVDRQNNVLMENRFVPPDDIAFLFAQGVDFVPEAGQSISTAHMRAIERLAEEIVSQMEVRW
jgi:hypothetical protein